MTNEAPVAVISGCGKPDGMGAAIARRLAAEGRTVVVTDREPRGVVNAGQTADQDRGLDELVAEIRDAGGTAEAMLGDVGSPEDVERILAGVQERYGRLDILVNNAAAPQGADRVDVVDVPLEAWDLQLRVNLTGAFLMARAAVPLMRERRYGRIVTISSMAGVEAAGRSTAYSASKAGVLGMTRALAMDVAGWGITANAICPGLVATSRSMLGRTGEDRTEAMTRMSERIAVGRVGTPEDIAHVVAFFAHEASGYVTAQTIGVDGGGFSPYAVGRPTER
jgi:3-oxoacyl-[acyl-carrier protein] reductase